MIRCKRVYDPREPGDGYRVLIDRLWPRGLTREKAAIDAWPKHIAPSNALRLWYGHRPERWREFQARYRAELTAPEAVAELERLRQIAASGTLTLLTATRAEAGTHATVLSALLKARRGS